MRDPSASTMKAPTHGREKAIFVPSADHCGTTRYSAKPPNSPGASRSAPQPEPMDANPVILSANTTRTLFNCPLRWHRRVTLESLDAFMAVPQRRATTPHMNRRSERCAYRQQSFFVPAELDYSGRAWNSRNMSSSVCMNRPSPWVPYRVACCIREN